MKLTEALLAEFLREAGNTRKVLERVPQSAWDWRPHEKSYPMGKLAAHIASLHGAWFHSTLAEDGFNLGGSWPAESNTVEGVLATFDKNVAELTNMLKETGEAALDESWNLRRGDQVFFEIPRWAAVRFMAMNHILHHRSQLTVYLRMNNVPLPALYGPSADEAAM